MKILKAILFICLATKSISLIADDKIGIIDVFENYNYNKLYDAAAKNAAIAYGKEFKSAFESRFKMELPDEYTQFAENCYFSELRWASNKSYVESAYISSFNADELKQIIDFHKLEPKFGQFPKGLSYTSLSQLAEMTMNRILDAKSSCFEKSKNNVKSFFKDKR